MGFIKSVKEGGTEAPVLPMEASGRVAGTLWAIAVLGDNLKVQVGREELDAGTPAECLALQEMALAIFEQAGAMAQRIVGDVAGATLQGNIRAQRRPDAGAAVS